MHNPNIPVFTIPQITKAQALVMMQQQRQHGFALHYGVYVNDLLTNTDPLLPQLAEAYGASLTAPFMFSEANLKRYTSEFLVAVMNGGVPAHWEYCKHRPAALVASGLLVGALNAGDPWVTHPKGRDLAVLLLTVMRKKDSNNFTLQNEAIQMQLAAWGFPVRYQQPPIMLVVTEQEAEDAEWQV